MPRMLLHFVGRGGDGYRYHVHFVEADCATTIGRLRATDCTSTGSLRPHR